MKATRSGCLPTPVRLAGLAALLVVCGQGCVVRVYQPLAGLHRPIALDRRVQNFLDTQLDIHCFPGDALNNARAGVLCDKVTQLFENQGATVHSEVGAGEPAEVDGGGPLETVELVAEFDPRTRLVMDLRARETSASSHPFSWLVFVASLTILPGVMDSSFAQEVIIRDSSGVLLVSDTLEGRLISRYGFGVWFGNRVMNLTRKKPERLGADAAEQDLSKDLYAQLCQDAFNAKMFAKVLELSSTVERSE